MLIKCQYHLTQYQAHDGGLINIQSIEHGSSKELFTGSTSQGYSF